MLIRVQYLHVQTCITSPFEGHCSVNRVLSFVQRECVTCRKCITSYHSSVAAFIMPRKYLNEQDVQFCSVCVCVETFQCPTEAFNPLIINITSLILGAKWVTKLSPAPLIFAVQHELGLFVAE